MKQLKVTIEKKIPQEFFNLFGSIGFWNQEGQTVYQANKEGKMGSPFTQEKARTEFYEDFVLNSLAHDFKTVLEDKPFKCGKGGSHIWVSNEKNERLLIVNF